MTEYGVTVEEALGRLEVIEDYDPGTGPQPCVHTFMQGGTALLGAHWTIVQVREAMEQYGVEEAGPEAVAMGHGLVILQPAPPGPLFLATKREETS